jgi:predicted metal-dependent HD superfamily phosphohydrolase
MHLDTVMLDLAKPYYNETHRHYHKGAHIYYMFNLAKAFQIELSLAQELAILFHDIVYVPGSSTNEKNSVQLMKVLLLDRYDLEDIDRASAIIMDTQTHDFDSSNQSEIVMDLDLAGLGETWKVFAQNTKNIREEFRFATTDQWREGRITFLHEMLSRKFIYHTKLFRDKFEIKARQNMEKELYDIRSSRWTNAEYRKRLK